MSLSSQAVFRNLFLFPGSFFDRLAPFLKGENNTRVVILIPQRTYGKYAPFLSPYCSDRLIIEPVILSSHRNIFQKLFSFFYSYLIYTGTTKLMATMGTRPDEPPAGGKWYLAPLKSFIANTLGRFRWIKITLVPFFYFRFYTDRPFHSFFKKYTPDSVFVPHLYGWFDTQLIAEAKRNRVPTQGMPAGWDHLDKYFLPLHVDRLLVPSEQVGQAAIQYQAYGAETMQVVGYPHFDFMVDEKFIRSRAQTLAYLKFKSDAKYILYVSGSSYCPDEPDVIETLLRWADEGKFGCDVNMVIRPYLGGRSKDKEFDEEKFNRFEKHPRVRFYRPDFWGNFAQSVDFLNIMRHADAVLAVYTTMVLEACVLDRPLVAVAFDGYTARPMSRSIRRFEKFEHFQDVLKTGAMKTAYTFDELFTILDAYFRNPQEGARERQLLRKRLCYKLDGGAWQRIMHALFQE